jgi:PBP1b-binding outer membrane lipoprotein LpoB
MHSLKEKFRLFTVITLSIILLIGCSAGKYPAKKKKTRKMKACDCPTFGMDKKATNYYYNI